MFCFVTLSLFLHGLKFYYVQLGLCTDQWPKLDALDMTILVDYNNLGHKQKIPKFLISKALQLSALNFFFITMCSVLKEVS